MIIFFLTLLLFTNTFAQFNNNKVDSNYYGYWLNQNYYNALINLETPLEAYKYNSPYIAIIISKEKNKIGISKYLNEIGFKDFIATDTSLQFEDTIDTTLYTIILQNKNKILVTNSNSSRIFVKYPDKFLDKNKSLGSFFPHYLINEIYFAGNYTTLDSLKQKVTFTTNGKVQGIKNYTSYYIFANYLFNKKYNAMRFGSPTIKRNLPYFAWELSDDTLTIFSTVDSCGLTPCKGNLFLKLLKNNLKK